LLLREVNQFGHRRQRRKMMMSGLLNRIERRLVYKLLDAVEWAVALRREIKATTFTDEECEHRGLPSGYVDSDTFAFPIHSLPKWYLNIWDEGDCVVALVLGWRLEVFYEPKQSPVPQ